MFVCRIAGRLFGVFKGDKGSSMAIATMNGHSRPEGSVVIIGAGTQGRRLAFMVGRILPQSAFAGAKWHIQWTSRGGNVTLVDLQEQQLQDGLKYVQQLRAAETEHTGAWGAVKTAHPDALETVLKDSWLVVEVCHPEPRGRMRGVIFNVEYSASLRI